MISRMQIDFKKYNADGIGSPPTTLPRVASYRRQPWAIKSTSPTGLISPTSIYTRGFNDGCALAGRRGRAHRHRPYQSPPNHVVCHYPIGVILSIAQGWQVQRSLPWVTMQARRLPTTWVVLFSPHCFLMSSPHNTRGRECIAHSRPHS